MNREKGRKSQAERMVMEASRDPWAEVLQPVQDFSLPGASVVDSAKQKIHSCAGCLWYAYGALTLSP